MGLPLYDASMRTTVVTSGAALAGLVPQAAALGTGRMVRLRQVAVSNTTATGFGVGLGIGTTAGTTPTTAGTGAVRRSNTTGAIDAPATATPNIGYATTPTAPTTYSARLWVPGSSMVVWVFNEGEELYVPPAATALPFCVFNTGTGQIADVTLTWEE